MRATLRQLCVFGLVGIVATAVHYTVALSTHEFFGIALMIANLFGYVCAVGVSYIGHGRFTFRAKFTRRNFRRYVVTSVSVLFASELLLAFLESYAGISHRLSLAAAVLIIPPVSFALNKFWVYRPHAH
jgi:putative flippase GtrA